MVLDLIYVAITQCVNYSGQESNNLQLMILKHVTLKQGQDQ